MTHHTAEQTGQRYKERYILRLRRNLKVLSQLVPKHVDPAVSERSSQLGNAVAVRGKRVLRFVRVHRLQAATGIERDAEVTAYKSEDAQRGSRMVKVDQRCAFSIASG